MTLMTRVGRSYVVDYLFRRLYPPHYYLFRRLSLYNICFRAG